MPADALLDREGLQAGHFRPCACRLELASRRLQTARCSFTFVSHRPAAMPAAVTPLRSAASRLCLGPCSVPARLRTLGQRTLGQPCLRPLRAPSGLTPAVSRCLTLSLAPLDRVYQLLVALFFLHHVAHDHNFQVLVWEGVEPSRSGLCGRDGRRRFLWLAGWLGRWRGLCHISDRCVAPRGVRLGSSGVHRGPASRRFSAASLHARRLGRRLLPKVHFCATEHSASLHR